MFTIKFANGKEMIATGVDERFTITADTQGEYTLYTLNIESNTPEHDLEHYRKLFTDVDALSKIEVYIDDELQTVYTDYQNIANLSIRLLPFGKQLVAMLEKRE